MQEISDDTDLTYYDRNRLESEFKKLKELKHKADQYAIEAKQTAQRLSAENFKLKEDLSRERHFNELERKNLIREMEAKMGKKEGEEEREEAKKEVMEQAIVKRATELATTMRGPTEISKGTAFTWLWKDMEWGWAIVAWAFLNYVSQNKWLATLCSEAFTLI